MTPEQRLNFQKGKKTRNIIINKEMTPEQRKNNIIDGYIIQKQEIRQQALEQMQKKQFDNKKQQIIEKQLAEEVKKKLEEILKDK